MCDFICWSTLNFLPTILTKHEKETDHILRICFKILINFFIQGKPKLSRLKTGDGSTEVEMNPLSEIDKLTVGTAADLGGVQEDLTQVYDHYSFDKKSKSSDKLSVMECKSEVSLKC